MRTIFDPYILVWDIGPGLLLLCVSVGAVLTWKRTKRASAMVQVIAAITMFVAWMLILLRLHTSTPLDSSVYSQALWAEPTQTATITMLIVCPVVFSIGYVWFATRLKRI